MAETEPSSASDFGDSAPDPSNAAPQLPRDLPPVEPPSAGLIVQLFLVPALIVGVIIAVSLLFGKLAQTEQDWRQLKQDVSSENPYIRWRGALGLAQLLDADSARSTGGEPLRTNAEIAEALAGLYVKLMQLPNPSADEIQEIEFLSKALGRMAVPDKILPALLEGMLPNRDRDVRKHSLIGLAMLAGTMRELKLPLESPEAESRLIEISQESDPLFRQQAAFALGLLPSPRTNVRLESLLEAGDEMTRLNAAIAFARNDNPLAWPVLRDILHDAAGWKLDPSAVASEEQRTEYFERMLMITNAVKALAAISPRLTQTQRTELRTGLEQLRDSTSDAVLRTAVLEALAGLK